MDYDVILIGGISHDRSGRAIGPFRLRTAFESAGYSLKVIDYGWALNQDQMINLLSTLITDKTKILGISAAWYDFPSNKWAQDDSFFKRFRKLFPNVTVVVGGTKTTASSLLYNHCDWFVSGFSDIAFVRLANYLYGKTSDLIFTTDVQGTVGETKIVLADKDYQIENVDDIETVFKLEDSFLSHHPLPIEISRGCIFKCAFCTHPFLGKKSYDYIRTAESLGRELKRNYDLFGTYRYMISDDTFNDSYEKLDIVKRAIEIAKLSKFEFVSYIRPELIITKPDMLPMLLDLGIKGGFIGLESMRKESRQVVGKGIDVERVLEMAQTLNEKGVKMHASLIAGLPNDTEEEIYRWNDYLIENRDRGFRSWSFNALGLMRTGRGDVPYSLFEKNPGAYGYITKELSNNVQSLSWVHTSGMTSDKAQEIALNCTAKSAKYIKIAAWDLAGAWFHDMPEDVVENLPTVQTNFNQRMRENSMQRANYNYNLITGDSLT
jgi:radical SAM superfamily enzyme YgiQ (UPF0313 family)